MRYTDIMKRKPFCQKGFWDYAFNGDVKVSTGEKKLSKRAVNGVVDEKSHHAKSN